MDACPWTTVLSALLTPTIAVLAVLIAYRQWRTAQNRLKFDLFDRRVAVYDSVHSVLTSIALGGKVQSEVLEKFVIGTRVNKKGAELRALVNLALKARQRRW